jgi:outer membrane protein assembly factor BamD
MEKNHYELALKTLEELKPATAGTRLGGEVQFLLARAKYHQGKFAEAEAEYKTYLALYPEGFFSEEALYMAAVSKLRQIKKTSIGFFSLGSYVPHDRDISALTEARGLYEQYLDRYPSGQWKTEAGKLTRELREKEGEHYLEIISFYLKKKQHKAALARSEWLLESDYPEGIKARALEFATRAGELLSENADADAR